MNTLFSKLKAAMVKPLMAPPVPSNPAENPEKEPPIMAFLFVGDTTTSRLNRNNKLNPTKNIPKNISKMTLFKIFERNPPTITKTTDGIPMVHNNLLSSPFRNKNILLRLLER